MEFLEEQEDDPSAPERKAARAKRKDAFPIDDVVSFFTELRDQLVVNGQLVPRNAAAWETLREMVMKKRSKPIQAASLHAMTTQNRFNLLVLLGLQKTEVLEDAGLESENDDNVEGSDDQLIEDDGDDKNEYTRQFTMTISAQEWSTMSPEVASYNSFCQTTGRTVIRHYKCLKRRVWTNVVDDHFREHMRLNCKLTYTGGRVRDCGVPFASFKGKCEHCQSEIAGEIDYEPENGKRALFKCVYKGPYKMKHPLLKRQIKGSKRDEYLDMMVKQKMSSTSVRALTADAKMLEGEREPPQVPTSKSLRQAKYTYLSALRLHTDPVMSVIMAKHDIQYAGFIKDVTYEKFIVHFWNMGQIHAARNYVINTPGSKISIDASGGFVQKLTRVDGKKSGHIFLFEAVINDPSTCEQVAVASMLSERHDTETIRHWLSCWLRDGALVPQECDIDMSLALTAACIQAFAKMPSLQHYLAECAKILHPDNDAFVPPPCFIRYDVAHFMKLLSKLPCLNKEGVVKRTRQFYLRCMAQLIQCQDIVDAHRIISDIFIVALNESEGQVFEEDTPAYRSKKRLVDLIGKENEAQTAYSVPDGMDSSAVEELDQIFWDSVEKLSPQFGKKKDDFSSWGESIFESVVENCIVEGDWGNQQYLPDLPKAILKLIDIFPLWSAVMVPHYGYGGATASSASSESNFNDIKNRVFKHLTLPVRVDEFLQFYIRVLSGKIKINNASALEKELSAIQTSSGDDKSEDQEDVQMKVSPLASMTGESRSPTSFSVVKSDVQQEDGKGSSPQCTTAVINKETTTSACPMCSLKSYPDGELSCFFCGVAVHPDTRCCVEVVGFSSEDINTACIACSTKTHTERLAILEQMATDNWRGLSEPKRRKRKSYLEKNMEWLSVDLNDTRKTVPIGILKNGNDTGLKPIKIKEETFVLSNTCPFDSVLQIYATAFCDSEEFQATVKESNNWSLAPLIVQMATKGANVSAYRHRALMLIDHFPRKPMLSVETVEVACHVERMLEILTTNAPSGTETIECTSKFCPRMIMTKELAAFNISANKQEMCSIGDRLKALLKKTSGSTCREKMTDEDVKQGHAFVDKKWSKHPMCSGMRQRTAQLSTGCIWLLLQDDNPKRMAECTLRLGDLPKRISANQSEFHLRGVVAFQRPASRHRGAIGHYKAFCHRFGTWEIYDGLCNKVSYTSSAEVVISHAVCYTV